MGIGEVGAPAGLELLERSLGYTRGALAGVRDDLADAPTPCAGWRLLDLLRHMVDSLAALAEASVGSVAPATVQVAGTAGPEVLALRLRELGCTVLGGWVHADDRPVELVGRLVADSAVMGGASLPGAVSAEVPAPVPARVPGPVPARVPAGVLTEVGALEVAVHGWDVARTCDPGATLPPLLAAALLPVALRRVGPTDRPGRFGPRVADLSGTDPGSLLLAHLGRRA